MNEVTFTSQLTGETFRASLNFNRNGLPEIGMISLPSFAGKAYPVQYIRDYKTFLEELESELEVMLNLGPEAYLEI